PVGGTPAEALGPIAGQPVGGVVAIGRAGAGPAEGVAPGIEAEALGVGGRAGGEPLEAVVAVAEVIGPGEHRAAGPHVGVPGPVVAPGSVGHAIGTVGV